MKQGGKFVIIGTACLAVFVVVIYFSFANQDSTKLESEIVESSKDIPGDKKIVEFKTENQNANKILSDCGVDEHCIVEAFWNLASTEQEQTVLEALSAATAAYDQAGYYCHGLAHHLGMFLYGITGNMTKTLEFAEKRDCGGAMYHGAIENYFLTEMTLNEKQVEEIDFVSICNQLADDAKKMKRVECAHGTGHGLVKVYDYDVFSSVSRCDEFADPDERRLCYEGVFMENVVAHQMVNGGSFDKDDIFFPCNKLDVKYSGACYYYHATYFIEKLYKIEDVFENCNKLTPETSLMFCYMGIGRQFGVSYFDNFNGLISICQIGLPNYQKYCFQGALIVIADQRGLDDSFKACKAFPELFKVDCYTLLGDWIRIETPDIEDRINACSKAEDSKYMDICINAKI